jgi:hypothetical protein
MQELREAQQAVSMQAEQAGTSDQASQLIRSVRRLRGTMANRRIAAVILPLLPSSTCIRAASGPKARRSWKGIAGVVAPQA